MALENIVTNIDLDVYDHDLTPTTIKAIALDSKTRYVAAALLKERNPYGIPQTASVTLTVLRPDNTGVQVTGSTYSYDADGITLYGSYAELTMLALAVKGTCVAQFKVTDGEQILRTEIFYVNNGRALDADISEWAGDLDGHNLDEMAESIETLESAVGTLQTDVATVKEDLEDICPAPELTWILNRNVDGAGNISTNNYMAVTDAIPVSVGDVVVRKTPNAVNNKSLIGYLSEFNGTDFIRRSAFNTQGQRYTITDSNTTHIRVAFGRASSSGVQISQADVDNYFSVEMYRQAVTLINGFVNRGAISSLGYTSLAQCSRQGYYTFGSSDALSDLPTGWNGGGLVYVFVTSGAIWQKVTSLTQAFFRYGLTGTWYSERDYIYAAYESGSGENNSTERLNIHVPRKITNEKTMYQMGHCVSAESNADVWRMMFMYRVNYNDTLRKLTMTGEWECALHLDGRDDFSGGIVHGDEVDVDVKVFVDGTLTNITAVNTFCHELKIVKKSNLYDPSDHSTVIAEHGTEYIYSVDGLKIKQSVNWKVNANLTNCYLAMLPIIKTYSTHRYDDTSFNIVENNQTGFSVTVPNATSVTEFDPTYDTFAEMSKEHYPTGLTGGDCALISDNGGLGYNKVYFPVCSSASVNAGDLWQATSVYRNR